MEAVIQIDWEAVIRTLIDAAILGVVGFIGKIVKGVFNRQQEIIDNQSVLNAYVKEDIKNTIEQIYHRSIKQGYITVNDLEICDKQFITYSERLNGNSFVKKRIEDLHHMQVRDI